MYYPRALESRLISSLSNHKINIILGPRQCGKTTFLKHIFEETNQPCLFVDLDLLENREHFKSYREVIKFLNFNGYKREAPFVLFLDEFQGVKGIDKILKNLYDNEPQLKICATGSSSLAIVRQLKESLAGRKQLLYLFPLSFEEYIRFRDPDLSHKMKNVSTDQFPSTITNELNEYVKEFCIFGGYPEVALTAGYDQKKEIIRNIFDLYVKKDLIALLNIRNPDAAYNILRYLAINMGSIIKFSNLSSSQNIDINTLKRYLNILNETFIVKTIPPFFSNKNKEIVRSPKIYFIDPGVRNYFLKNFSPFENRVDNGFLIENFVFSQMYKKSDFLTEIKFWRDKNGREIDFVVERENKLFAYEVKYRNTITRKMVSALLYFKKTYPRAELFLVNETTAGLDLDVVKEMKYYEI